MCNSVDCSPLASSALGIFQARILMWAAMSSSRSSSRTRDWPRSPAWIAGRFFTVWATREAKHQLAFRLVNKISKKEALQMRLLHKLLVTLWFKLFSSFKVIFFFFFIFNWRIIALQYHVSFWHTSNMRQPNIIVSFQNKLLLILGYKIIWLMMVRILASKLSWSTKNSLKEK